MAPPVQYVIRFNGKVSWEGQSNGLPPTLYAFVIYEGDSTEDMVKIIEAQVGGFLRMQAFACQKDQGQVIDMRQTPAERMLVPFKWIVNITTDIYKLGAELAIADEQGVERMSDGSEPKVN